MKSSAQRLISNCTHWIFDMDGTLTCAVHDFDEIRRELGLPDGVPILEAIAQQSSVLAQQTKRRLDEMEYEIARLATEQPGAGTLLDQLLSRGNQIGVLTRNGHGIAMATLKSCGLAGYFPASVVISRDCCTPKPDAAGVHRLMNGWSSVPASTAMVGDYLFDLQAGSDAGTHTVHLDVDNQFPWPEITTLGVTSLIELSAVL